MTNFKFETLTLDALPEFCKTHLSNALVQKSKFYEGQLISQTIRHYIGDIQLLDYSLEKNLNLELSISTNSFFLTAEINTNSCFISYRPTGVYNKILIAGQHQILNVNFKKDWFIQKITNLPYLSPFVEKSEMHPQMPFTLPSYGISARLLELLKRHIQKTSKLNMDKDIYILLDDYVNKYHGKLASKTINSLYHERKALEIAQFINDNYASKLVEDLPDLASRFMISERHLARLAKMTFGIPLHSQVIKIRMNNGLNQLMTTNKTIYEISRMVGYREPYYFSKAFKKHFGIAPYGWKKGKILPPD